MSRFSEYGRLGPTREFGLEGSKRSFEVGP
jgi:hypothetical protein